MLSLKTFDINGIVFKNLDNLKDGKKIVGRSKSTPYILYILANRVAVSKAKKSEKFGKSRS